MSALFLVSPHDGALSKAAAGRIRRLGTFVRFERHVFEHDLPAVGDEASAERLLRKVEAAVVRQAKAVADLEEQGGRTHEDEQRLVRELDFIQLHLSFIQFK